MFHKDYIRRNEEILGKAGIPLEILDFAVIVL